MVTGLARTWLRRPESPTRLVVDVTRRCNLRCQMCRTWERAASGEMTATQYEDLFRQLPRLVWLDITGGEPFLRRDIDAVFAAAVEHASALSMLHFQTNGWMTERIVAQTQRLRRRDRRFDLVITVSIDGPPPVHDAIRGRAGSYARAIETARRLAEIPDVEIHVGTTIQRSNAEHLEELARTLAADLPGFSPARWHLNELTRSEHFFANAEIPRLEADTNGRLVTHLRRRGVPSTMVELMESMYLLHLHRYAHDRVRRVPCRALHSTAFIAPEGDVYPCHIFDRPLGNVTRRPLAEIWNGAEVKRVRGEVEQLACGGCFSACEAYPALAGAPVQAVAGAATELARISLGAS